MDGSAGLYVETVSFWQAVCKHQPFESAEKGNCHSHICRQFFTVRQVHQSHSFFTSNYTRITPPLPKGGLMTARQVFHPVLSVAGWLSIKYRSPCSFASLVFTRFAFIETVYIRLISYPHHKLKQSSTKSILIPDFSIFLSRYIHPVFYN